VELILPLLVIIPLVAGLMSWWSEYLGLRWPRWVGMVAMGLDLALVIFLWAQSDFALPGNPAQTHFILEYKLAWIPRFGISMHLAVDGLSLMLIGLTSILGLLAVACSWSEIQRYVGFFHLNLLWNLAGVIGVFMAMDFFLFFLLWEVMLVPMYFLIALWGHSGAGTHGRIYAATKFFIFTQASGLLMLIAILGLVWVHHGATGVWTFDYIDLLKTPMSSTAEFALMLGFFVAFAVKLPAFPFHSWLPDAHSQAPTAGSVDLAGVLLKTGAYGLMRFCVPLFPHASASFADVAMLLGVIGIVYGALLAMMQTDIKRLVAYTSISHMGFVLLGVYAGTELALQGVVVQMLAHGLSTGAMFVLCGELYERLHTRELSAMGGMSKRIPHYASAMMFFSLASLGLPGMGNFIGEFLILLGSFAVAPKMTAAASVGLVVAAVYSLYLVQRMLHGPSKSDAPLVDLTGREKFMMYCMMALVLGLGLYPQPVIDASRSASRTIESLYHSPAPRAPAVELAP
jgi:NADH-quinone oxidoreductase subunit M